MGSTTPPYPNGSIVRLPFRFYCGRICVDVTIKDSRTTRVGTDTRRQYLVKPREGTGEMWIDSARFQRITTLFRPDKAHEAVQTCSQN